MAKNPQKSNVLAVKDIQAFLHAVAAKGIQHFDLGGGVQPTGMTQQSVTQAPQAGTLGAGAAADPTLAMVNPVGTAGSTVQGIASDFTAQNGFNAQLAPTTQLNYAPTANAAVNNSLSGGQQLQGTLGQEQGLTNQLLAEGNGQGPNPAQAALNQQTGQNIASQAALMAGQRGASSNAGLIARQAAQQGANTQQQAVGQSATLQAQQQLAAQQGAASLLGQSGNQITNEQGVNNQLASTAIGANNTQNANLISNYGMAQGLNQSTAQSNANAVNGTTSGLLSGASSVAALLADGGPVPSANQIQQAPPVQASSISQGFNNSTGSQGMASAASNVKKFAEGGPVSFAGQFLNSSPTQAYSVAGTGDVAPTFTPPKATGVGVTMTMPGQKKKPSGSGDSGSQTIAGDQGENTQADPTALESGESIVAAKGGKVPAMVSPGEKYLPPKDVKKVKEGKANPMQVGETIHGKAKVEGNSYANDTVPKMLESGGIVVPRNITQGPNAAQKALAFVKQIEAKQGLKRGKK